MSYTYPYLLLELSIITISCLVSKNIYSNQGIQFLYSFTHSRLLIFLVPGFWWFFHFFMFCNSKHIQTLLYIDVFYSNCQFTRNPTSNFSRFSCNNLIFFVSFIFCGFHTSIFCVTTSPSVPPTQLNIPACSKAIGNIVNTIIFYFKKVKNNTFLVK